MRLVAATATNAQDCKAFLEPIPYPRLARIASVSGTVRASFAIENSGSVGSLETQGHPILIHEVVRRINSTNFPAHCLQKRLDITVDFRLEDEPADEAHTTVSFPSPGKVEVTSNITGIICMLNSQPAGPRSRVRRFLRALAAPIQ